MKRIIGGIAAAALLAGCSAGKTSTKAAPVPAGGSRPASASAPTSTAAITPDAPTTADVSDSPPPCSSLVGKPVKDVFRDGSPYCITGVTVSDDDTGMGTTDCTDTVSDAPVKVYDWYAQNAAAPDQVEYVGRADGNVIALGPSQSSNALRAPVGVILLAVGDCTIS